MKQQLEQLKERYIAAKSEKEKERIDTEMQQLVAQDGDGFAVSMVEMAKATADRAEQFVLREQMEEVLSVLSVSALVKHYFKKSPQWFYQRLNGNLVNGKPAKFTGEELDTLRFALKDISIRISSVSIP